MKRLANALGVLGAVLLLTSPLTYFFTGPADWVSALKAGLGVAGLLAFGVLRRGADLTRGPLKHVALAVVGLLAVVAANVYGARLPGRWDLTREKLHSLSPQTLQTLRALPDPVQITALIPQSHPSRDALETLLRDYQHASHGKVRYLLDDAQHNPALAARFGLREGEMAVILERPDGARTALSAVSENELTLALVRLSRRAQLNAYFLQGHGEPAPAPAAGGAPIALASSLPPLQGLSHGLEAEGYRVLPLFLASAPEIPRDADVVLLLGPQQPLSPTEREKLERYLEQGGHLLVLTEPNVSLGIEELLSAYGILLDPGVVAEPPAPGVDSPYVVLTAAYGEHPVSRVLRQGNLAVQLITARALTLLREGALGGVKVEPVVFSGPAAWEESQADASPHPSSGEKVGRLTLAAASTRGIPDSPQRRSPTARLFVLGEADLVRDVLWGSEPNRNLVLNAIAWAAAPAEGASAIQPVERIATSLALSVPALRRLRFLSVDLLPLLFLAAVLLGRTRRRVA